MALEEEVCVPEDFFLRKRIDMHDIRNIIRNGSTLDVGAALEAFCKICQRMTRTESSWEELFLHGSSSTANPHLDIWGVKGSSALVEMMESGLLANVQDLKFESLSDFGDEGIAALARQLELGKLGFLRRLKLQDVGFSSSCSTRIAKNWAKNTSEHLEEDLSRDLSDYESEDSFTPIQRGVFDNESEDSFTPMQRDVSNNETELCDNLSRHTYSNVSDSSILAGNAPRDGDGAAGKASPDLRGDDARDALGKILRETSRVMPEETIRDTFADAQGAVSEGALENMRDLSKCEWKEMGDETEEALKFSHGDSREKDEFAHGNSCETFECAFRGLSEGKEAAANIEGVEALGQWLQSEHVGYVYLTFYVILLFPTFVTFAVIFSTLL